MATALAELRLRIRYDEGSGPVIVLLHGINSDAESWRTVIDTLGPGHRVIAPDLLGFGGSPKPDDLDYTADEHAAVLAATLDDLGLTERFVLVGYSMGGNVALRYAATHPDRLRRLVLLSAPFYLPPEAYSRASFGRQYAQARFFQWLWRVVGRQKDRDTLVYGLATGALERPVADYLRTDEVAGHWDIMQKNLVNTVNAATFVDDLPRVTVPTVFALGIRDPIVRPDQTMALRRIRPTLEVRRIVGLSADHMLLANAPARVAHEILADEVRRLHVALRLGAGDPVVLLPGLGDDARAWEPVARLLADRHEVVVLDLLGFGSSPRPLSSHYSLADHAAAVHASLLEFPDDAPVTLVGRGVGATVALECAAADPARVGRVVAFSPVLLDPLAGAAGQRSDPGTAALLAARDAHAALARDERSQRLATERIEAEVVPTLRTIDAVLATDAAALLARQASPVRIVVSTRDPLTPRDWLVAQAPAHPGVEVLEVDADAWFAHRDPAAAAAAIAGGTVPEWAGTATVAAPGPPPGRPAGDLARRLLGGATAHLVRHGVLALVAGLVLLLAPWQVPPRVLAWGFAGWLLVEAVQTIAGAVGLRRDGNAWLGWLLIGLVSLPFAALLALGDALALRVLVWTVAGWALARAGAALFSAWRAPSLPGPRWGLIAEGVLALAVGVGLLVAPETGARLLRWILGGYLTASGLAGLALARATHRAALRRVHALASGAA